MVSHKVSFSLYSVYSDSDRTVIYNLNKLHVGWNVHEVQVLSVCTCGVSDSIS